MSISILIADDHDIIRQGIKNILHSCPGYEIVAEAKDGEEALAKIKKYKPDILLLDISMPKISGLDIIEKSRYISPETKILVVSVHKAHPYIMKAFKAGAKGYLQKENAGEELLPALTKVAAGKLYLTSSFSSYFVERSLKKSGTKLTEETFLTSREQEVLRLVADGKTAKEIAGVLYISPRTVENHKNVLLQKLGLHKTSDLIKYAVRHNLVEIDEY